MSARPKVDAAVSVRSALREAMGRLEAAKVPSHTLAAELLLMHAVRCDRTWLYSHPDATMDDEVLRRFFELVARRAGGVPTQYLTGKQEFWGLEFEVTPAVLIPRPETEHLVEVAMERLGESRTGESLRIADVGTGSGCIAVALARQFKSAEILATEISSVALDVARRNAARHGVSERIHFTQCDLLGPAATRGRQFDLVVSNPPYVASGDESQLQREVREHEPHEALFAGAEGIGIYTRLIAQAAKCLRGTGVVVVEVGYGASERVRGLLDCAGWKEIRVTNDLAGIPRVISANLA
ncbi:MAG TPA: peptide chain release factor N(5)-glutamine methyltransferase [Candidatus Acidoferrales bacterium]|nr:peptide chain release factor N(5)-glutamine methyltransferase [Candidatus Acidoferrales bacterium]